ncbi:MAG: AlkZ family DNA glycosylase [Chloroflexi bacterium]|nr:AlkZ family DNA glycosylase [Chloroflexota bacterium]MBV9894361.1 AlkZ family DNA glycosylase [Chloroflexota bacterium]
MRLIDVPERRARLSRRQHLAGSALADTPEDAARDLVALHGTDPATVFLSVAARVRQPDVAAMEDALYTRRVLIRMLGMRRTMFVVHDSLAPVVQAACTNALAVQLKRRYQQLLSTAGVVDDVPDWWARVAEATVAALRELKLATAQELGREVPELRTQIRLAEGKNYEGTQSIATWMLMQLSAEGRIVRGQPRGSWISSQYRWAPIEAWLPGGVLPLETLSAQATLIHDWLHTFGPGTIEDLKWWTGLTMAEVKRAVQSLDVTEVDLGEASGLLLTEDLERVAAPEPWVTLLPALDVTPMAYVRREWFLGPHAPALFDRSGNIGPTVWSDGHIVGGWAQRQNGTVVFKLLEDVGRDVERAIESAAHRLGEWLGPVRITPRFRTPLERELSGA